MKYQTLTKHAPYGATYAEIIDWLSIRGYDIHFEHPFAISQMEENNELGIKIILP